METKRGSEYNLKSKKYFIENNIPYRIKFDDKGKQLSIVLDYDAILIQACRYRRKNLKKQDLKIALIIVVLLLNLGVQLLVHWDKLYQLYWWWGMK